MDCVTVRFLHPRSADVLTLELPRDTKFAALTKLLYEKGFVEPQKPGYKYLYQEHLCGMEHTLGDYIPASETVLELELLYVPFILV